MLWRLPSGCCLRFLGALPMGKLRRAAHDFGNAFFRCWRKVNWLTLGNLFFLFGSVLWLVSPILPARPRRRVQRHGAGSKLAVPTGRAAVLCGLAGAGLLVFRALLTCVWGAKVRALVPAHCTC